MEQLRMASVGTSRISRRFWEAAAAVPAIRMVGVCSRSRETAAAFGASFGAGPGWDSIGALAADPTVDAVYIASPNSFHKDQALAFLNAGKAVLCEKPATSNESEWRTLCDAAAAQDVFLMEALRTVYAPGFAVLREWLARVGPVRQISFRFCQYSSRYDNFKRGVIENAFRPELSNGALMDIGVYPLHVLMALFGEPRAVTADAVRLENGLDGAGMVIAHYETFQALVTYSKINDDGAPSVICGENGSLQIDRIACPRKLTFCPRGGQPETVTVAQAEDDMRYEAAVFAEQARGGYRPAQTELTRQTLHWMDEIRRQQEIRFPADGV